MIGRTLGGATVATMQGMLVLILVTIFGFRPYSWPLVPVAILFMLLVALLFAALGAERAFLRELGAGCSIPAGAFARADGDLLDISGVMLAVDGSASVRHRLVGADPEALGRALRPRHRAPIHERLGIETFLRAAFDMGGVGGCGQFLVGLFRSTDHVVAFRRGMAMEGGKIMRPALHRDEAGAGVRAGTDQRYGGALFALWIFGTVDIAGEVPTAVGKGIDRV